MYQYVLYAKPLKYQNHQKCSSSKMNWGHELLITCHRAHAVAVRITHSLTSILVYHAGSRLSSSWHRLHGAVTLHQLTETDSKLYCLGDLDSGRSQHQRSRRFAWKLKKSNLKRSPPTPDSFNIRSFHSSVSHSILRKRAHQYTLPTRTTSSKNTNYICLNVI